MAYSMSGRSNNAIMTYRQLIKLKPDSAEAWYALGRAFLKAGQTNEAVNAVEQGRKLKPNMVK